MRSPAPLPDQLGEFKIEALLGEGGSGTVYAATWGHREVALKVLRGALLPAASERRRFLDEARLLAEVNHPGVVRILGFGELPDGRPYLAMERLEGESLAERLGRGGLATDNALAIFDQLCQAVQTLHDKGLIHRDIKPENIFLMRQERLAVLLDFGIAKPVDAPDSTVTREGGIRGTPAYMAPERFFGAAANPATDVYELGVVLYAMLTGQLPWEGSDDPVSRLNPQRPSDLGVSLPGGLEEALLEALASRAESRPQTAAALARRVSRSLHETPSAAPVRRTADMSTTGPGTQATGPAELGTAPTELVTPSGATPRGVLPRMSPIASYWSDSNPSIVVSDLRADTPRGAALSGPTHDGQTRVQSAHGTPPPPGGHPFKASALGVRLPTPEGSMPVVRPNRWRWLVAALGLALLTFLGVGLYLLFARPPMRPLSVGATGLVRPPDPKPRPVAKTGHRPISRPRDRLAWRTLPSDTAMLLMVSYDQLQKTAVWKAITSQGPLKVPQLEMLRKSCQMDLLDRLTWLSLGFPRAKADTPIDVLIRGRWSRDEVERCVGKLATQAGVTIQIKRDGKLSRVDFGSSPFWLAWPDEHTFLISSRGTADEAWMKERLAGLRSARLEPALRGLYNEVSPKATAWLVVHDANQIIADLFDVMPTPQSAAVTLKVSDTLRLEANSYYATKQAASKARDAARIQLHKFRQNPVVKMVLSRTDISGTGRAARFVLEMNRTSALLLATALPRLIKDMNLQKMGPRPRPQPAPQ